MDNLIFKNHKFNPQKGISLGFRKIKQEYLYTTNILNNEFNLTVKIKADNSVKTELTENLTGEIYTLHLLKSAEGNFVGKVREEYENVLNKIAENCFDFSIFKSAQTYEILNYAKEKYGTEPEYLWEKFPDNAVLRCQKTKKWYAAILTVNAEKFGFSGRGEVEVINLHAPVDDIQVLLEQPDIYPAYHMNKKHWYSIILDNSVKTAQIRNYIDESYKLAQK